MKIKIFAIVALLFTAGIASAQSMDKWPALKELHTVMAATFHPAEEGNLQPLREVCASATATPFHIRLDFSDVTHMDSASIALLMLLYGHQSKIGYEFSMINVTPEVKRVLRLFCADYLLEKMNQQMHQEINEQSAHALRTIAR